MRYVGAELDSIWTQIFYHVWWPGQGNDPMYLANRSMNQIRNNYYENNFTPHMFTNGRSSSSNTVNWKNDPKKYLDNIGLFDIAITGTQNENDISFSVTSLSMESSDDTSDIRLFIAIIMGLVEYPNSPNGLTDHHDVVIDIVTGNEGKKVNYIAELEYQEIINWSVPDSWIGHSSIKWNNKNLKVVAWIQNYASKEILQVSELDFN